MFFSVSDDPWGFVVICIVFETTEDFTLHSVVTQLTLWEAFLSW